MSAADFRQRARAREIARGIANTVRTDIGRSADLSVSVEALSRAIDLLCDAGESADALLDELDDARGDA